MKRKKSLSKNKKAKDEKLEVDEKLKKTILEV